MLINNNPNLINNGGKIKVPLISKEDFIDLFIVLMNKYMVGINFAQIKQIFMTDVGKINIDGTIFEEMEQKNEVYGTFDYVLTVPDEINQYLNTSIFNNIVGVKQTTSGIPFLGCFCGGEQEIEIFRVIYFDGSDFNIYTPHYGNCWNIDDGRQFNGEEDGNDDYVAKYGISLCDLENAIIDDLFDEKFIMQEINQVFSCWNLVNKTQLNPTNTPNQNNNSINTKKLMDVSYEIFSKKMLQMIPPLQQSLIAQGAKTYDKSKCFQNLRKDTFQNDICNFILQFDNCDSTANKIIECTKIALYIKRFQYYYNGLILE